MTPITIFIKSFNRPYYLERCIRSIQQNVQGDYSITVLDDGTPEIYLVKLKDAYPKLKIVLSPFSEVKRKAIDLHIQGIQNYTFTSVPSMFWYDAIQSGSDVFLLMEEDSWFTKPLNLDEVSFLFTEQNLVTLKLGWNGNDGIVRGEKREMSRSFEEIRPDLPLKNRNILFPLLRNRFRLRSLLTRAGLMRAGFLNPYYTLYTVCSAFFRKEYWLYVWKDAEDRVDETHQLERALTWKDRHRESMYGKSKSECIRTSFITSSVATKHKPSFDMIRLNHHLSQRWLINGLDVMENMPLDFSLDYLMRILEQAKDPDCSSLNWKQWITIFKNDYRRVGCEVD